MNFGYSFMKVYTFYHLSLWKYNLNYLLMPLEIIYHHVMCFSFLCFPFSQRPYFIDTSNHFIRILVLGFTCLLDGFMYGTWILVPLKFLNFNFFSSGGDYYGTHKWHWYFTQGFPVMIFSHLPFCIAGIIYSKQWKFAGLLAWVLGFYSILGHKEFRYFNPNYLHMHILTYSWPIGISSWIIYICMLTHMHVNYYWVQVCLASSSYSSDVLWLFFGCDRRSWFSNV